jgi:hypothetical protein
MTTINLANEPITGKPRVLNVNLTNLNINYSVDLKNTDGTLILAGEKSNYMSNQFNGTTKTDAQKAAEATLATAVEKAYADYYKTINS